MAFNEDFDLKVGQYNSTLPTIADGCPKQLQLDESGRLIISGRYFEDSAHASGDAGIFIMGVRNDNDSSFTDADGDYSPIAVDEFGRVKVLADLDVDFDFVHAEDSAHTSGDLGSFSLSIRMDDIDGANSALLADTNGDYQGTFTNAKGELYVKDADVLSQLVDIDAVLDSIKVDTGNIAVDVAAIEVELLDQGLTLDSIDTTLDNLSHAEDDAHVSGDQGIMAMGVQQTADVALADDGDYAPYQLDEDGFLKVNVKSSATAVPGDEAYNATDDLAAGGDGLVALTSATFTNVVSIAVPAGQTLYLYGYSWEADGNAVGRIVSDDGTNVAVYKMGLNTSAMPGKSEHFSEGGRIEIPGSATMNVRLQLRKRKAACDDFEGFGSLHARLV